MKNLLILLVLVIAFVLVASCEKEEFPPAPYVQVETGLQKTNTTYKLEGVRSISFTTPDGLETQRISSYGGASTMQGDVSVYGTNLAVFRVKSGWTYVQFRSETCQEVEIVEILYTE